jgi:nucleoside-diphosphate-sugar epimerase
MVRDVVIRSGLRKEIEVITTPTNDTRSYHISSEKIKRELGFEPRRTIEDAIRDLCEAFREGRIPDSMTDVRYYNLKTMQARRLT